MRVVPKLRFLVLGVVVVVASACGGGGGSTASLDPASAESCAELADMSVGALQNVLNELGSLSSADLETDPPAELEAATDVHFQFFTTPGSSAASELCGPGEFEQLMCEQESSLATSSQEADEYLNNNFPPCD